MRQILSLAIAFVVASCTVTLTYAGPKAAPGAFDIEQHGSVIAETHSLGVIIDAIKKQSLKKNDFETSEQYQSRLAAIRLPGDLPLDATIAIKFQTDQIAPFCENKYNADTREITMSCEFGSRKLFVDPINFRALPAWTVGMANGKDTGTYTGTNAFGTAKKVTKRVAYGRGLAFDNFQLATTGAHENYLRKLELTLPEVSIERARSLVRNMGVVFIVDVTSPFFVSDSRRDSPSLSSPVDFSGEYDYLFVRLRQMWLVDLKSGEALRRFDNARDVLQN